MLMCGICTIPLFMIIATGQVGLDGASGLICFKRAFSIINNHRPGSAVTFVLTQDTQKTQIGISDRLPHNVFARQSVRYAKSSEIYE